MGQFGRLTSVDDLPSQSEFLKLVKTAMKFKEQAAASPRPRVPRKPAKRPKMPPDLAAAIKKNKAANEGFAKLSPSCQREYVQWINEAKREETRARRIATTVEWTAQGKSMNWKYE